MSWSILKNTLNCLFEFFAKGADGRDNDCHIPWEEDGIRNGSIQICFCEEDIAVSVDDNLDSLPPEEKEEHGPPEVGLEALCIVDEETLCRRVQQDGYENRNQNRLIGDDRADGADEVCEVHLQDGLRILEEQC